jgi:hypothetical protein
MRLSVSEADLLADALAARAARYTSMSRDDTLSIWTRGKYEARATAMRRLLDKIKAMRAENKPMELAT